MYAVLSCQRHLLHGCFRLEIVVVVDDNLVVPDGVVIVKKLFKLSSTGNHHTVDFEAKTTD